MQQLLITRLLDRQVPFVLIGGMAGVAHGSTLVTQDLDICIVANAASFLRIQAALEGFNPRVRSGAGWLPLNLSEDQASRLKNLNIMTDLGKLDCLGEVLGIGDYQSAFEQSIAIDFDGYPCRVLSIDALIRAKKAVGRPRDLMAVAELEAIQEKRGGSGPDAASG
jgi:hypothetical protein